MREVHHCVPYLKHDHTEHGSSQNFELVADLVGSGIQVGQCKIEKVILYSV